MNKTTPPRPGARRWIMRAVAVLGLSTLMADGGLREDEIDCEEARGLPAELLPGLGRRDGGLLLRLGVRQRHPETALSIDDSQCILAESCSQIVSSGMCDKVTNLASPTSSDINGTSTENPPVCP